VCDAWNGRAKADDSVRENFRFDGPDALVRRNNVEMDDGTERLAGLNVPARREWPRRVVVVLIDSVNPRGKTSYTIEEPDPNSAQIVGHCSPAGI
jgi:hypothetical protein